jgi:DNA helicase II / ATP-dependent DNA helicase PcrA
MGLRSGQKELVEQYRGGFCAVPAIPGGGKTHCLSLWAAEIIALGLHKPGKILIVTYMNTAVNNFKQRISKELQNRGILGNKDYFVSTIHGLCLQIIKEKPDLLVTNEEFEVVDSSDKSQIIHKSIDDWKKDNEEKFRFYIDEPQLSTNKIAKTYKDWQDKLCNLAAGAIGDFKTRGLDPVQAKEKCRRLPETSILKWSADIYAIYDRRLKALGFLDFDDMLYKAKKILLEDSKLLETYRKKYSFVCEDEAQDSNLIQSDILTLIANGNLLRVGDSNQAICGSFSNSDFTLFKDFCSLPETTVYKITQSSRNTREIIDVANYFVKYIREEHTLERCRESLLNQIIEPVGPLDERPNPEIPEYGIKAEIFDSWEIEASNVVNEAKEMLKKHPDMTIAILIPNSWKISFVVSMLENRNIPFEELDNTSGVKNKTVRTLGKIIDFIALPEDGEKLAEMVDSCLLLEKYDEASKEEEFEGDRTSGQRRMLSDFLKKYPTEKLSYSAGNEIDLSSIPDELLKTKIWSDFTEKLDLIRSFLEFPSTAVEKLILFISEKMNFEREERAIAQKVASDVRYLMSQNPRWRLSDLAVELLNPRNMFNFFAGIVWDLKGYEPKPGVVTVSTYHKSKGLEWDVVFLTALTNEDFPFDLNDKFKGEFWFLKQQYRNPQAIAKADMQKVMGIKAEIDNALEAKIETISERARLLYVGITRAKKYLYLSGYNSNMGKKNDTKASKYLLQLKKYIEEVAGK